MPLAPPVTTTILPATCIAPPAVLKSKSSGQNQIEHRRVMAGRAQQHEGMPDRVLETQPLPGVKDYAETIEQAAGRDEPQGQGRQRRHHRVVDYEAAPAHRQKQADRQPAETAGPDPL